MCAEPRAEKRREILMQAETLRIRINEKSPEGSDHTKAEIPVMRSPITNL